MEKTRSEAIREYQRRYYLEKIKNKPKPFVEKEKELVFQLQKRVNGEWVVLSSVYK
jgi:hypothetical protein